MERSTKEIALPKDLNLEQKPVNNVSEYIERINHYIQARGDDKGLFVYRGEPGVYPTPCRPQIFRKGVLAENPYFEKNLFDSMRQNKLTEDKSYLENAIDAQHGEFPSRLLDVSYNCLTALYFAVTPYYHREEDSLDGKDGMVFLFFLDEIFSPSAQNLNENYKAIINRDVPWAQAPVFRKNHKFVDHTKRGPRIIAQQGAFILFQGEEAEELPKALSYGIRIPAGAKKRMRRELKQLFGIHTGSIYPEISNLVKELTNKSNQMNTQPFTCENELRYTLKMLRKELEYYLDYAMAQKRKMTMEGVCGGKMDEILTQVERVVNSYREKLLLFIKDWETWEEQTKAEVLPQAALRELLETYNQAVQAFSDKAENYELGEFSAGKLSIPARTGQENR